MLKARVKREKDEGMGFKVCTFLLIRGVNVSMFTLTHIFWVPIPCIAESWH